MEEQATPSSSSQSVSAASSPDRQIIQQPPKIEPKVMVMPFRADMISMNATLFGGRRNTVRNQNQQLQFNKNKVETPSNEGEIKENDEQPIEINPQFKNKRLSVGEITAKQILAHKLRTGGYLSPETKTSGSNIKPLLTYDHISENKQEASIIETSDHRSSVTIIGSTVLKPPQTAGANLRYKKILQTQLGIISPNLSSHREHLQTSNRNRAFAFFKMDYSSSPILKSQKRGGFSASISGGGVSELWNQNTFSYSNSIMQNRINQAAKNVTTGGSVIGKSEYLSRMKKVKVSKLQMKYDEEKNDIKSKREVLSSLKSELESIKIATGNGQQKYGTTMDINKSLENSNSPITSQSPNKMNDVNFGRRNSVIKQTLMQTFQRQSTYFGQQRFSQVVTTPASPINHSILEQAPIPPMTPKYPTLKSSLYQPFFPMMAEDYESITSNLLIMKQDLELKLKVLEHKQRSEQFTSQQLHNQGIQVKQEVMVLTIKNRETQPEQIKYEHLVNHQIPRVKLLSDTSKEQSKILISERKRQLERKREFYESCLREKIKQLRVESREIDELKGAIAKRQKRVDEVKEHLGELKQTNEEEEIKKQEIISSLMNRNLEFKVLSGLEIIVKLEQALKSIDCISYDTQQSIKLIHEVKTKQIDVGDITKDDFELMNKKKIEKFKSYEQHFAQFFPNLKQIQINDTYLQQKYDELCININSMTIKFQDLVNTCNFKKKLIHEYQTFKDNVEKDKKFLTKFQDSEGLMKVYFADSKPTLNDMKGADIILRTGIIDSDLQHKKQLLASAYALMNATLTKICFVLMEMFFMIRIEDPKKIRAESDHIPLSNYLDQNFLEFVNKYGAQFIPINFTQTIPDTESEIFIQKVRSSSRLSRRASPVEYQSSSQNIFAPTQLESSNQLQVPQGNGVNLTRAKARRTSQVFSANTMLDLLSVSANKFLQSKFQQQAVQLENETGQGFIINKVDGVEEKDKQNNQRSSKQFDIGLIEDFKRLFVYTVCHKKHEALFYAIDTRNYSDKAAGKYLKRHKILGKFCKDWIESNLQGHDPAIHLNGVDFSQKNPQLMRRIPLNKALMDNSMIFGILNPYNGAHEEQESHEDDEENSTMDLNPKLISKKNNKISSQQIPINDNRFDITYDRRKPVPKIAGTHRAVDPRKLLQNQILGLKNFERKENQFRSQFKDNLNRFFSNQFTDLSNGGQEQLLDGPAIVQSSAILLKNTEHLKKNSKLNLTGKINLTSSPIIQRNQHKLIHNTFKHVSQSTTAETDRSRKRNPNATFFSDVNPHACLMNSSLISQTMQTYGTSSSEINKPYTQRVLERQLQRRTIVKIEKPQKKKKNVVLQMLKEKFPELDKLFMDTEERRILKRIEFSQRKGSLQSENIRSGSTGPYKTTRLTKAGAYHNNTMSSFYGRGDDNTQKLSGGNYTDDHIMTTGGGGPFDGTFDMDGDTPRTIIKVKPVFSRGSIF